MLWLFVLSALVSECRLSAMDNKTDVGVSTAEEDIQTSMFVYKNTRVDDEKEWRFDSTEHAMRQEHYDTSVNAAEPSFHAQTFSQEEVTYVTKASTTQAQLSSPSIHVKGSSTEQLILPSSGMSTSVLTGGFWSSPPSASPFPHDTGSTPVYGTQDHVLQLQTSPAKVREAKARLLGQLGSGTDKIIPGSSTDDTMSKVSIVGDLVLMSVVKVDDALQTVTTNIIVDLSWQDVGLSWNQSLYEGVRTLVVPKDQIWTPEIFVANAMDKSDVMSDVEQVFVSSDGTVHALFCYLAETVCPMDLSGFPYDQQNCTMIFLSFHNFDWKITMRQSTSQLGAYLSQSNQWKVLDVSSQVVDNHGKNVIYTAYINITLRRLSTFYTVCLVLPMVLTSYMNTLVFLLPLQSGEKISFLVTLSVSTSVFIGFFSEVMPRGLTTVPGTFELLIGVIVQSLLVLVATIVVLRVHHREQEATNTESAMRPPTVEHGKEKRIGLMACPCGRPAVSALGLDHFFFVLALLSNTVFLGVLLFKSFYS